MLTSLIVQFGHILLKKKKKHYSDVIIVIYVSIAKTTSIPEGDTVEPPGTLKLFLLEEITLVPPETLLGASAFCSPQILSYIP